MEYVWAAAPWAEPAEASCCMLMSAPEVVGGFNLTLFNGALLGA